MELVRGIPITEYCDKHRLSTRERLELLYGGRATLRCGPGAGGGYLCAITLPEAARG